MTALERLLEVQEHDIAVDRLRHRRATLPERAELAEVERQAKETQQRLEALRRQRDEVVERQTRLEADVAASEKRAADIEARMSSGAVRAGRDLEAMAEEIESLKRRVSSLEDQVLEAMEEREPLDAELDVLEARTEELRMTASRLIEEIRTAEADIDREVEAETRAREDSIAAVDPAVASEYERLRVRLDGIGVARLVSGSCAGCHLSLPATEIDRLKRMDDDEIAHCDQCGRILVR